MPTYMYIAQDPAKSCARCREGFDVLHGVNESGPEACPDCGAPVRKAVCAPYVSAGRWSSKRLLSSDNLRRHGFETGTDLLESGKVKL